MSKTTFAAVIAACILLFTSCGMMGDTIDPPDLSEGLSLYGEIAVGSTTASVGFEKRGDGEWEAVFTAPEGIEGLKICTHADGKTEVSMLEMAFEYPEDKVPFEAAVCYIEKAVDNAAQPENISLKSDGDKLVLSGSTGLSGYIIYVDDGGKITEINTGGVKFTASERPVQSESR